MANMVYDVHDGINGNIMVKHIQSELKLFYSRTLEEFVADMVEMRRKYEKKQAEGDVSLPAEIDALVNCKKTLSYKH